jgi:hypothetical protein
MLTVITQNSLIFNSTGTEIRSISNPDRSDSNPILATLL